MQKICVCEKCRQQKCELCGGRKIAAVIKNKITNKRLKICSECQKMFKNE